MELGKGVHVLAFIHYFEFILCNHVLAEKMLIHILAAHIGALAHDGQKVIIKQFAKLCAFFCSERLFLFLVVPIL